MAFSGNNVLIIILLVALITVTFIHETEGKGGRGGGGGRGGSRGIGSRGGYSRGSSRKGGNYGSSIGGRSVVGTYRSFGTPSRWSIMGGRSYYFVGYPFGHPYYGRSSYRKTDREVEDTVQAVKPRFKMSATGIILLILFFIGLALVIYYTSICLPLRSKTPKHYKNSDQGPLLGADPDHNGNNEPEVLVEPNKSIDEPDNKVIEDDDPEPSKAVDCHLLTNVSFQTTPQCASKDPKSDAVYLPIEDEPFTNTSKPVMVSVRRDLKPTFMAIKADSSVRPKNAQPPHSDTLSNSYEEDGLLVPRKQVLSEAVAPAALILGEYLEKQEKKNSSPPKKHVQFNTTPEEGTSIDDQPYDPVVGADLEKTTSDGEKPVFRLNPTGPLNPIYSKEEQSTPYPLNPTYPTAIVDSLENKNEDHKSEVVEVSLAPVGWNTTVSSSAEKPEGTAADLNPNTDNKLEIKPTIVKIGFINDEEVVDASCPPIPTDSESDTSDPDVTEYSFQTGPIMPSTAVVLGNEMASYSDPKVSSFVSLPDGVSSNVSDRPPTPSTEERSNSAQSAIDEHTENLDENDFNDTNVLGTPPKTPPLEKMSTDFVISNPAAEETSPHSGIGNSNRGRSDSISSSMSSSSNSSESSSSTNGSYKIQNNENLNNKVVLDNSSTKSLKLKK